MSARPSRFLYCALWGSIALGLFLYLALTLWLALTGIFFPYQLDYGEGIILWFTRQLALGHSIYQGLTGPPFDASNYPPLAMVLAIPWRALFGDSYIGGRWLNFAATLITSAFIWRFVRAEIAQRPQARHPQGARLQGAAAALAALFFIGSTYIYHWIPLFRADLIGLAFTVAGIFFVWRWQATGRRSQVTGRRSQVASGRVQVAGNGRQLGIWDLGLACFFLAALYTKHSLVVAPLAAFIAIFLRNRRAALIFALALGGSGGGVYLALDLLTNGGLTFGLITANATLWLWSTFLPLLTDFVRTYFVLIMLAAWGWWTRVRAREIGVLEIYAAAAAGSLALAGRVGAYQNYFFEAVVVVCVFAGIQMAALCQGAPRGRWLLPLALLFQLALYWHAHDPAIARELFAVTRAGNEAVAPLVRDARGSVISEDMGLLVTNGKPVEYYTFVYSNLARAGKWDQRWEVENLRAGKFPLVILSQGTREDVDRFRNFTREFLSALDYGYALTHENARYEVYQPAPLAHLGDADFDGQLRLIGWSLTPERDARAGDTLRLTVVWQAEQKLHAQYKTFAHLQNATGGVVAQDDHEPKGGVYPTTRWGADEMVRETYALRLPENLAPGVYALRVGWYDLVTQDRLGVRGGEDFVELDSWIR